MDAGGDRLVFLQAQQAGKIVLVDQVEGRALAADEVAGDEHRVAALGDHLQEFDERCGVGDLHDLRGALGVGDAGLLHLPVAQEVVFARHLVGLDESDGVAPTEEVGIDGVVVVVLRRPRVVAVAVVAAVVLAHAAAPEIVLAHADALQDRRRTSPAAARALRGMSRW